MAKKKSDDMSKDMSTPIDVESYLGDIDYPASKQDLLDTASDNDAPEEVINALNGMADKEYSGPTDVTREISKQK